MSWNGIFYNGVWSCGFDFLADGTPSAGGVLTSVNGSPSVGATYARVSGKGLNCPNGTWFTKSLGVNLASMTLGIAFKTTALPIGGAFVQVMTFFDTTAAGQQFTLAYNSQGQLGFYNTTSIYIGFGSGTPTLVSGTSLSAWASSSPTVIAISKSSAPSIPHPAF